jgi:tetratricopeptide (TPR) repeat protein
MHFARLPDCAADPGKVAGLLGHNLATKGEIMKSLTWILCLGLFGLLSAGCGNSPGPGRGKQSEAERKAAEEADRQERFDKLLHQGKKALETKQFEEAVRDFEEANRLQNDPQARDLLQQAQKAWNEARKVAYKEAMLRGEQARKEKNYPAAVAAFRDALRPLPDDKPAAAALQEAEFHDFVEKGRTALQNKQYADAVKYLGEAQRRQPEDKDSRELLNEAQVQRRRQAMEQGRAALTAKQYAEAERLFTEARDLSSDAEVTALLTEAKFQGKLQLGHQRVDAKQYTAAIADLEEALRLKPNDAETRNLLDKAKEGKKRQDEEAYDRALASGDSAMQRKDYQAAINAYREALDKQPNDGTASTKLTQAQNVKSKKDSYDRHMSSGKTQLSFKNYRSAEMEFQAALSDLPGDPEAQRLLQQARSGARINPVPAAPAKMQGGASTSSASVTNQKTQGGASTNSAPAAKANTQPKRK